MDNFKFMVAARADKVCFMLRGVPSELSVPDALELAAWIVAMFDHDGTVPKLVAEIHRGE